MEFKNVKRTDNGNITASWGGGKWHVTFSITNGSWAFTTDRQFADPQTEIDFISDAEQLIQVFKLFP